MSKILLAAYHLADQINESDEVENYLQYKQQVEHDQEAQQLINEFQKVKELFTEAQRFGIFHPNYHEAKEQAKVYEQKLRNHPLIGAYLQAEEQLDQLLYQISTTIAHAVSESIKIPSNQPLAELRAKKQCSTR